jgi:hypothetical protein
MIDPFPSVQTIKMMFSLLTMAMQMFAVFGVNNFGQFSNCSSKRAIWLDLQY